MHIIEETQVFREPQSVDNLVVSPMQVDLTSGLNMLTEWGTGETRQSWGIADRLFSLVPAQPLRGGC